MHSRDDSRNSVTAATTHDTNLRPPWATSTPPYSSPGIRIPSRAGAGVGRHHPTTGVPLDRGNRASEETYNNRTYRDNYGNSRATTNEETYNNRTYRDNYGNSRATTNEETYNNRTYRDNSRVTPEVTYERARPRTTESTHRYGGIPHPSPHDRDLPFFLQVFPYRAPSRGSATTRERERERRGESVMAERRGEIEARARREVELDVPLRQNVLTVLDCNLNLQINTKLHHTDLFACTDRDIQPQLVVRRGQAFTLIFTFQRPWNADIDDMMIKFEIGENPLLAEETRVQLVLDQSMAHNPEIGWAAKLLDRMGNKVSVAIFVPADAIVGEWKCELTTRLADCPEEQFVFDGVGEIFILFNAWLPSDQVHFQGDRKLLNEYVLNEYGCVFEGTSEYISCRPWFYGQFRDGILDVCMTILRLAFDLRVTTDMADAVTVARKLSRILNNSSKDPGILTGNWTGNYSGGTRPSAWRGSVQILKQFARTKSAVNFAQCFVFSHVFTTVLRALGIPARSLTNYESAHDTDKTVTIDSYEDEDGNDLPNLKSDSIWNFHCWNDVWINRPDLDLTVSSRDRYSGWHAVDCTPQERSGGRFQCGPCPVTAIRYGEVSVGFDTPFIYGEVNGEVCTWMVPRDSSREYRLMERKPNAVGEKISTKIPDGKPARGTYSPGHRDVHARRMDITALYKYPEGSEEERYSLKMAVGNGFGARIFQNSDGVGLEVGQIHNLDLGSNFEFKVILSNQSALSKQVNLTLVVYPIDYRGERLGWGKIANQTFNNIILSPNTREVHSLKVNEMMYIEQCDNTMSMMLRAFVKVKGEEKPLSKLKKVVLTSPQVAVKTVTPVHRLGRGQPFTVCAMVTNPSSKPMTKCRLHLGGTIEPIASQGFEEQDGTYIRRIKDIFPNEIRNINIEVKGQKRPLQNGTRELEVDVLSRELPEMSGSLNVELI